MSIFAPEMTQVAEGVIVRPMLTLDDAIDLFLARGFADKTRADYGRILSKFAEFMGRPPRYWDVAKVTEDDCLRFLSPYRSRTKGYQATVEATLASFFRWLYVSRKIKTNPMAMVTRTRRPRPEDLNVTRVSEADVVKLLATAVTWRERLCLGVLLYLGPRRGATARLRLSDYDRANGLIRFREKGSKTIWKPVPHELAELLESAIAEGVYTNAQEGVQRARTVREGSPTFAHGSGGAVRRKAPLNVYTSSERRGIPATEDQNWLPLLSDPYLIPPEGPLSREGDRDDRVIWRIVKDVADRASVKAHVHALRAAFAVFYLRTHDRDIVSLQELLGHAQIQTTMVYLRELDRGVAMETNRDLSWLSAVKPGAS